MKIAYASDLHVDVYEDLKLEFKLPVERVDVLILAGDIHDKGRGLQWAHETYKDCVDHIIVVYGNHDYWRGTFNKFLTEAREAAKEMANTHFLENNTICINGVWFIGATCWTDFTLGSNRHIDMFSARDEIKDYKRIVLQEPSGHYRKLRPTDTLQLSVLSGNYIFSQIKNIRASDPGAMIVVVTHHGPTPYSLSPDFAGSPLNPAYVNTFENRLAFDKGPDLWIHGHIHHKNAYRIGRTAVVCNPTGYPGQFPDAKMEYLEIEDENSLSSVPDVLSSRTGSS